jgi:hypothetical protein
MTSCTQGVFRPLIARCRESNVRFALVNGCRADDAAQIREVRFPLFAVCQFEPKAQDYQIDF